MSTEAPFHIITLGCKLNQYESQSLREAFAARGGEETSEAASAGTVVINSCAVTAKAVADLRAAARRVLRENPDSKLVITGCAAQVLAAELSEAFPDAVIVPQDSKDELLRRPPEDAAKAEHPEARYQDFSITEFNRVRAVVKVQDGCSQRCTYCIVPNTRGGPVSRPPAEAAVEIRGLFESGWREATLSGINLRQYGPDLAPDMDFWDLVAELDRELAPEWAGRARLRLSSLDPAQLNGKALDVLASCRMVCPHLHLSLQSMAPAVLRRMNRAHYGPEEVVEKVESLTSIWPVFGLGADLLVGFPGETDDDFRETLRHLEKLPLSYAHVFPYSRRPGTPAAKYADQVPGDVSKARAAALRALTADKKARFMKRLAKLPEVGVVLEPSAPVRGVCEYYADCRFEAPVPGTGPRDLVQARPVAAHEDHLAVAAMDNGSELA